MNTLLVLSLIGYSLVSSFPETVRRCQLVKKKTVCNYYKSQVTSKDSHPFLVHLEFEDTSYCSGTLISRNLVLTAAHCIYGKKLSDLTLIFGVHDLAHADYNTRQVRKADKVIFYPNYKSVEHDDIALVAFKQKIILTPLIQLVTLPLLSDDSLIGHNVTAIGWSHNPYTSEGVFPNFVRYFFLKVNENVNCENVTENKLTKNQICTTGQDLKATRVIHGDTGGPILDNNVQVGIVSYYAWPNITSPVDITVHTRVSSYLKWIYENIVENW